MAVPNQIVPLLKELIHDLVLGNYAAIEISGRNGRLNQEAMQRAITTYGRTLVDIPDSEFAHAQLYQHTNKATSSIDIDLWTEEEGRSDLTLSVLLDYAGPIPQISIQDIHVL